ncbi:UNVERIFIED_CONTAM: putative manganese-transporting ATPase PDR2 [Sesamum calycinum]|uniref:Manganese-transporting ATPase PDR2 n=1 Tax=Sesamum calycinum TaxID=2727403 RepID=A0AAW2RB26_9LAMI
MSRFHVGGKVVDTLDLLRKRHWGWRLDMWPFTILYGVWLAAVVPSLDFGDASIVLGGILAFHVLVFLFTVWSVDFKCFVQYSKVQFLGSPPCILLTVLLTAFFFCSYVIVEAY